MTEVDLPDVAPSSARVSISEETVPEGVDVCEESKNVVDISVVVLLHWCLFLRRPSRGVWMYMRLSLIHI